ncbi:Imm72 family immunity protein [Paraburkholderia bryophila]|uniref:Immunity protein 71 of polymorphic toxin system n=1 Tax=Paraburkholderia bryophila TaxID=420952 RepID=A0A329C1K2_9BURK|nr:Imm72 family immunity protein [Paraburkholderia bryophila]RAS27802.1 immunity protein 71 of polymorphic toxin system [Paraburkholderia bryophila]
MKLFNMRDETTRRQVFWLLKRLTSYSLWAKKRDDWEVFARAYENAVKTWPSSQPEQMLADNLPRIYGILSAYNKGLDELRRGYRFIWRRDEAFDQALTDYHVVAKYLYPDGDYWERGIQEAPYPPKVEALNVLMRASEYVGEHAACEVPASERATAHFTAAGALLNPKAYVFRFYQLSYPVFPEVLPAVPPPTGIVIRSGDTVPVDGIWEPVTITRGKVLGLIPMGATSSENAGCFNYLVQGTRAPRMTGAFNESSGHAEDVDVSWCLLWKDDRYTDGTIPEESEYFLATPEAVSYIEPDPVIPRVRTGEVCPATGHWQATDHPEHQVHVLKGVVMPDLVIKDWSDAGKVHYVEWTLLRQDKEGR